MTDDEIIIKLNELATEAEINKEPRKAHFFKEVADRVSELIPRID